MNELDIGSLGDGKKEKSSGKDFLFTHGSQYNPSEVHFSIQL